ncbi:hypothetical protein LEMLEM_LOCUS27362 [Lemmus lemmus]
MEAADWTGIGVCVRLVEGVGGGELRQLAFFGGSLSWHLGGHQAVARAGGLQVPAAEAAPSPAWVAACFLLADISASTWRRQRAQMLLDSFLPPEGSLGTPVSVFPEKTPSWAGENQKEVHSSAC